MLVTVVVILQSHSSLFEEILVFSVQNTTELLVHLIITRILNSYNSPNVFCPLKQGVLWDTNVVVLPMISMGSYHCNQSQYVSYTPC